MDVVVVEKSAAELQVPVVDLSLLHDPLTKSSAIQQIGEACQRRGCFHVINHGVPNSVIEAALDVNSRFFELPSDVKENLSSDDVLKEVRFGYVNSRGFSRDFLKLYSYPLDQYVSSWPRFPQDYRDVMEIYATEVRKLAIELFGAIMESLNLGEAYLRRNFEQGEQILGINWYTNPCSGSSLISGQPPHTDHSIITILLQSSPGFQVIDRDDDDSGSWKNVSGAVGSFQVLVGDHLEVISNGLCKSVWHRAISSSCEGSTRLSIANLHSLAMHEAVEPAKELVIEEEGNPIRYRGSSLSDFLKHLASGDKRAFIETVKIK